jgi:hypothetical protein
MAFLLRLALAVSPLVVQAGANPMALPAMQFRQEPDHLGAVASESEICSNIGIDLLKGGGNAADAVSGGSQRMENRC